MVRRLRPLRRDMVEHGPDQLGLLRMQDGLDLDHAVLGIAATDEAALLIVHRVRLLAMPLDPCVLAR